MTITGKVLLGELSDGSVFKIALADPGQGPEAVTLYGCTSLTDFEEAISAFVAENGNPPLAGAAFSTSGWEVDGHIHLVHYGFTLDRFQLYSFLGTPRISMVNNFVAKALAIPVLNESERVNVCGTEASTSQVVAVVGPTTGLGCAFLSPNGRGGWVATHCEGGHSDFAPGNGIEIEILKHMMEKYGHVSRERAVSALGLCELYRCLTLIDGERPANLTLEEILAQAYAGEERAKTAVRIQTEIFAGVASDFALMTGAKGGVYLSGSHLDALGPLFDHDVFTQRFFDKGRVSSYVRDIPVYKIVAEEPEILGISTLFDEL